MRAEARRQLRLGRAPIPVPAGSKRAVIPGWPTLRLTEEILPQHFNGSGNIGLLTGEPSDWLTDVDLDCPEAIELAPMFLPPTGAKTGRPSTPECHWWYTAKGAKTTQHKDPTTKEMIVELRSTGVQTLVGPSVHPSGEPYSLLDGEPAIVDAADLTARVAALAHAVVLRRHPTLATTTRPPLSVSVGSNQAPADPDQLLRRAEAYLASLPAAISGHGGHAATYTAATALVHGFALDPEAALALLRDKYNTRCEPPWSDKELRHKIDDAARKPHELPRGWLRDAGRPNIHAAPPTAPDLALDAGQPRPRTDLGNAERMVGLFSDQLRYCHSMGKWLTWDGPRWKVDDEGAAERLASETARRILREAVGNEDSLERRDLAKWALTSESRQRIEAMVALARSRPELVVHVADLDSDPWLLNVENGTIDLRTGELRPHDRGALLTKLAPVNHDPEAVCPLFMSVLGRIFAKSQELIGFVQRWLGHSLTGDVSEQRLPIFHGQGGNGKNVLLDTIKGIMGDYAADAPPHLLVERKGTEHPTEIADLLGRRLVTASETEEGAVLKIQLLKRLTGDGTLKGRYMRHDFFEFPRTHKLILVTNNKPRVKEDSEAVWRRIILVPFDVVIPEAERDTALLEKLKGEWPGILAWLVRGCLDWQRAGLQIPAAVLAATTAYRQGEDGMGRFLEERCCVHDPAAGAFTAWKPLYTAYLEWAEQGGERALGGRKFGDALGHRGITSATKRVGDRSCKVRLNVSLIEDQLPGLEAPGSGTDVTDVTEESALPN